MSIRPQSSREFLVELTTDGSGDAEGFTKERVFGYLERVIITYDGAAGTTDVTIEDESTVPLTLLEIESSNTDGVFHPVIGVTDAEGDAVEGAYRIPWLHDTRLKVTVASGGEANGVSVRVLVTESPSQVVLAAASNGG